MEIPILYRDGDFLIVNKPAGMLVHPAGADSSQETLVSWLTKHFPQVAGVGDDPDIRPGIVHRLDKDTSGILVVALTKTAFSYLKHLFQTHSVKKTYLALVVGRVREQRGVIDVPIGIKKGTLRRTAHEKSAKNMKPAITEYEVVKRLNGFTLVRIFPKTGRTHQIRVHLHHIGHPVAADPLYGRQKFPWLQRQFLHAESIEFTTPKGNRLRVSADLPVDLEQALIAASHEPAGHHPHN